MTAAREAGLSIALAERYNTPATIERVAEQAGVDTSHLPLVNVSPADAWYSIVQTAAREDKMSALRALVQKERGRDKELMAAWDDYERQSEPEPPPQPARRNHAHPDMSDYRTNADQRIDRMQSDLADLRVQVAGLIVQVATLTDLVRKQGEHETPSLSNAQFVAILLAFLFLVIVVYGIVYYGGNR